MTAALAAACGSPEPQASRPGWANDVPQATVVYTASDKAVSRTSVLLRDAPLAVPFIQNGQGRLFRLLHYKAGKAFWTSIWNSVGNHRPAGTSNPGMASVG
jgi:hypothetical protein